LISVIPLKYVSSYIGVTPQALSRIRKRINWFRFIVWASFWHYFWLSN
jgi:hypothetical protein